MSSEEEYHFRESVGITSRNTNTTSANSSSPNHYYDNCHVWLNNWDSFIRTAQENLDHDNKILEGCTAHKIRLAKPSKKSSSTAIIRGSYSGEDHNNKSSCNENRNYIGKIERSLAAINNPAQVKHVNAPKKNDSEESLLALLRKNSTTHVRNVTPSTFKNYSPSPTPSPISPTFSNEKECQTPPTAIISTNPYYNNNYDHNKWKAFRNDVASAAKDVYRSPSSYFIENDYGQSFNSQFLPECNPSSMSTSVAERAPTALNQLRDKYMESKRIYQATAIRGKEDQEVRGNCSTDIEFGHGQQQELFFNEPNPRWHRTSPQEFNDDNMINVVQGQQGSFRSDVNESLPLISGVGVVKPSYMQVGLETLESNDSGGARDHNLIQQKLLSNASSMPTIPKKSFSNIVRAAKSSEQLLNHGQEFVVQYPRKSKSSRDSLPSIVTQVQKTPSTGGRIRRTTITTTASTNRNQQLLQSTKIRKGSYLESITSNSQEKGIFPTELLKPLDSPKTGLTQGIVKLKEEDWETIVDGFRLLVCVIRFNPETVRGDLHVINMVAIKHITSLRSQVSRTACAFFKEMFQQLGKLMEIDLDKIVDKLLDKSADTNKFIREDSIAALETMVQNNNISSRKILTVLDSYGTKHRNALVRLTTAKMVNYIVGSLGAEKSLTDLANKLLPMLISLLQEGSEETRALARSSLGILATHRNFEPQLRRHVPADTLRHVNKSIAAIKNDAQGRTSY